jgi:hypothetical protein
MFTQSELETYHKVRHYLRGGKAYGWEAIYLRVHRDDAPKVRALVDELNRQRWPELEQSFATEKPPKPVRFGKHEEALLARLEPGKPISEGELREFIYSRVQNPSSRRQTYSRTVGNLQKKKLLEQIDRGVWCLIYPADTQPDCGGQTSR